MGFQEPINNEGDIIKFCEETGVPVALDETVNSIGENILEVLQKYSHPGVAAVVSRTTMHQENIYKIKFDKNLHMKSQVIKPSVIGGFEHAALVARWAQQNGKIAVVSAAFESALGLSAYIQFAHYLDLQNAETQKLMNKEATSTVSHGFGTYKWFKEEVTAKSLNIRYNTLHGAVEADATDAGRFLQKCHLNSDAIVRTFVHDQVKEYELAVDANGVSYSINVLETGESIDVSDLTYLLACNPPFSFFVFSRLCIKAGYYSRVSSWISREW